MRSDQHLNPIMSQDGELLDAVRQRYQPRYAEPLTREDAREILYNLSGFYSVLGEMKRAADAKAATPADPKEGGR